MSLFSLTPAPLSHISSHPLEGDWPIFDKAEVSSSILEKIRIEANGSSISSHLDYLSLGTFLISTTLLEPHPTQRLIIKSHVNTLRDDFTKNGVLRLENPSVVIGLGPGWYEMKKTRPGHIFIGPTCPHLSRLSLTPDGPIGQVIRGGHRTAAINAFSSIDENCGENYWAYNVLIPGMFYLLFYNYDSHALGLRHQHPPKRNPDGLCLHRQPCEESPPQFLLPHNLELCPACSIYLHASFRSPG